MIILEHLKMTTKKKKTNDKFTSRKQNLKTLKFNMGTLDI